MTVNLALRSVCTAVKFLNCFIKELSLKSQRRLDFLSFCCFNRLGDMIKAGVRSWKVFPICI